MLHRSRLALSPAFAGILLLAACGSAAPASSQPAPSAPKPAGSSALAAKPPSSSEVQRLQRAGDPLNATVDSLKKSDVASAKRSFEEFDDGWNAIEVYVKARSEPLYRQIEDVQGKVDKQLLESASPKADEVLPLVQQVQTSYGEAIKLAQAGPAPNPVLNQLAELRDVRLPLRHTIAALKMADVATAKTEYKKFDDRWDDVESYVKDRSADMYRQVEDQMSQVSVALLKQQSPSASQVLPLAESLLAKYNDALKLVSEGVTTA